MSENQLKYNELLFLHDALNADCKICSIRLREGEYQYELAKAIASFMLNLHFPDVKDIIRKTYGEEKVNDINFIRKVQTILKKMEKSDVVKILPKRKPWELQRYALLSFKFQDIDKNFVVFATDEQLERVREMLNFMLRQKEALSSRNIKVKVFLLTMIVVISYTTILWNLIQFTVNPVIFIIAFSLATICSLLLGKYLSYNILK